MPPYTLPANANMMGLKSNSTKGGGGYNEIVLVDGKAGELIRTHAQKDRDTTVLNDDTRTVFRNREVKVKGWQKEEVVGDMSTTVTTGNQTNTVTTGNQINTVQKDIQIKSVADEIKITSPTKITLQVGENSWIEITPGKIIINSPQIESSAKGQNLITGVNVDINP